MHRHQKPISAAAVEASESMLQKQSVCGYMMTTFDVISWKSGKSFMSLSYMYRASQKVSP